MVEAVAKAVADTESGQENSEAHKTAWLEYGFTAIRHAFTPLRPTIWLI